MEGREDLLMKFEQARNELENHLSTVDGMTSMNDIRRLQDYETSIGDILEDMDKLIRIVKYLLSWRLHSVKRSINMVKDMIEKEKEKDEAKG